MGVDFGGLTLNSKLEGSKTPLMLMRICQCMQKGTCSASPVHIPGENGGRSCNYAIKFQVDSGYEQITTHSNTQVDVKKVSRFSFLSEKKKYLFLSQVRHSV